MYYWLILAIPVMILCVCFFVFYLMNVYPKDLRKKGGRKSSVTIESPEEPELPEGWLEQALLDMEGERYDWENEDLPEDSSWNSDVNASGDAPAAETADEPPKYFHRPFSMGKADIVCMLIITAVYAFVAFWGLGSRDTPESFAVFNTGDTAIVELPYGATAEELIIYTGIGTGKYIFKTSGDGNNWKDVAEFEQKYSELLKWQNVEFSQETDDGTSFIKLTATNTGMQLGEIRALDSSGNEISLKPANELAENLLDEPEVPAVATSYLYNSYFDEIYHARTAYEHIHNIYPYEVSHPPLGKLTLGLGIRLFGMNPFGWRFIGTLFGVLMLPLLYIFIKNMFGKTLVASCGTLLFAFDFMHFVQTRIATIDTYGVFYVILMSYFMYRYFTQDYDTPFVKTLLPLFLSGLFFGVGAASKWTAIYSGLALLIIYVIRQVLRGRYHVKLGRKSEFYRYLIKTLLVSIVFFIVIPSAIYVLSYIPYGTAKGMSISEGMLWDPEYLKLVWDNQKFMLSYHGKLVAEHPYTSPWWMWVIDLRPILYYLQKFDDGTKSAFAAFGNPVVWWTGIGAVISLVIAALKRRDKLAIFILINYMAQLFPWIIISRIAFIYHYFPNVVFIVLGICYMFNDLCERKGKELRGAVPLLTAAAMLVFVVFYPVLTGIRVNANYSGMFLRWFNGMWPF